MADDIKSRAVGRWKSILMQLGMPTRALSGNHGPCPICNGGDDRWRFDDLEGNGTFICSKCGAGRGVELVIRWKRVEYVEAVKLIESVIGKATLVVPRAQRDDAKTKEAMTVLWARGRALDGRDLASRYLRGRGLDLAAYSPSLRFVEALLYADRGSDEKRELPAMLAKFAAPDNSAAILHRTWLAEPGVKANVHLPRKMMAGTVPHGGAVRLAPAEPKMGIAEGIETALAAEVMFNIPVWAATNSGALIKWEPPPEATHIVIFGDADASYTGQAAAYSLAFRLKNLPDRKLTIEVETPTFRDSGVKADWNDALVAEQRMAA